MSTAQNTFFIVLTIAVVVLTVGGGFLFYYLTRILREGFLIVRETRTLLDGLKSVLERWEGLTDRLEERFLHIGTTITSITDIVMKLIELFGDRGAKKERQGKKD